MSGLCIFKWYYRTLLLISFRTIPYKPMFIEKIKHKFLGGRTLYKVLYKGSGGSENFFNSFLPPTEPLAFERMSGQVSICSRSLKRKLTIYGNSGRYIYIYISYAKPTVASGFTPRPSLHLYACLISVDKIRATNVQLNCTLPSPSSLFHQVSYVWQKSALSATVIISLSHF